MPRSFLILGAGGHGRVVADLLRVLDHRVVGFADRDPMKLDSRVEAGGAHVVALQRQIEEAARRGIPLPAEAEALALAIGDNATRLHVFNGLPGLEIPPLVHPASTVSPSASIGAGTVVLAGVVVNAAAHIGDAAIVNTGAVVEHDCVLADGVHVSPGAILGGGVQVGERAWIGAGAVVIQGVRIGVDVIVGAGAVVVRDVPDAQTVVGVPARTIRKGSP